MWARSRFDQSETWAHEFFRRPLTPSPARTTISPAHEDRSVLGETISHYRVLSKIGSGGMGVVYEAEDQKLGRRVALKFLAEHLCRDPHALQRFQREAYAASALSHPNICTVFDIDEENGRHFIALELLPGRSLREQIRGPLPASDVVNIGIQIADALQAAHENGIIHRDITSANIFVSPRGHAKVLDFGLAKLRRPRELAAASNGSTVATSPDTLTSPGMAVGTVAYMSPEQARGEELDARTDLFSFGAVLYEMATGRVPFSGSTSAVVFDGIMNRTPAPPSHLNASTPPELERIISKALEKDRELRYQTAAELAADLKRLKRDSSSATVTAAPVGEVSDAVLPATPRWLVRTLLVLIQAMYLAFYLLALASLQGETYNLLMTLGPSLGRLLAWGIFTGFAGIAIRLYLLTGIAMDYPALGKKFRRLFPFVLLLDWIWALSPALLLRPLGFGVITVAVVALLYLPFSQRTLMRMAYPQTSSSTAVRGFFGTHKSAH